MSSQPSRKRKIGRCTNTNTEATSADSRDADSAAALAKRVRKLEAEKAQLEERNARLEARVAACEASAQHLAQELSRTQQSLPRRPCALQTQTIEAEQIRKVPGQFGPVPQSPRGVVNGPSTLAGDAQAAGAAAAAATAVARGTRGAVRQRINSPRQFYLTLLAMYCSAFAHVMHGPNSENPILSRAEAQYELEKKQNAFTKHDSRSHSVHHGTASAGADMAGQKYERMLRASSHGLFRLIQFRRKIVRDRERNRRLARMRMSMHKLGSPAPNNNEPRWQ
mmetsp:Transcript_2509/g.3793  ORF Transcript_2509/g.3793 Transcript_2509/m.3793 type:complete len:280 (-) Transcript_2509:587-1426(-)|eukprot:CAMPEP_0195521810 /NCGR_PEP_ID=MMETSP0794_2-20130614/19406_1 /TAXON_ID=515487 /ORGANISM="Stephanopyxis turris, Strain CCMP 815" /LENGTH=279 /DNA_ID=CAMNT_0040651431 /DNA_START=222 /DNA_END=1061 /DNA_ORIENTATION=+